MSDRDKDIDALKKLLSSPSLQRFADTVTALVAERDGLKEMHGHLGQSYTMLAKECAALEARVAELEAHPSADRDRGLRKDLICAALTGILAHEGLDREFDSVIEEAIWMASKAMSKMQEESEQ